MAKLYIGVLLLAPLVFSTFQFFWGLENRKNQELLKASLSKFVYTTQFLISIYAFFTIEAQPLNIGFIHLQHYHYDFMFYLDKPYFTIATIFSLLFMLTEKMSFNYLHAEEEHSKFYSLKMILNFSLMAFSFSQNIDFLYFCWEVVGITSALLISYFYRRNQAVENSLFAFSIYRLCDAAFLVSALLLYHYYKVENISHVATGTNSTILGILLFITIMGKSGVYPLSAWLPQALEGPTPSSNLYYMTLSTHLGPLLMIKTYSLWGDSVIVKSTMIVASLITIIVSTISARSQTNIKGALAYSALSQVSLILIEVALGLHTFALIHIGLHVFHRLAQMALSPSIIDQHNLMEKLSISRPTDVVQGSLYFWGLNGFGSEKIVLKLFKLMLMPLVLFHHLEIRLLGQVLEEDEEIAQHAIAGSAK